MRPSNGGSLMVLNPGHLARVGRMTASWTVAGMAVPAIIGHTGRGLNPEPRTSANDRFRVSWHGLAPVRPGQGHTSASGSSLANQCAMSIHPPDRATSSETFPTASGVRKSKQSAPSRYGQHIRTDDGEPVLNRRKCDDK